MGLINSASAIFTIALVIFGYLLWILIKMVGGPQLSAHEVLSTGLHSYFHMDHRSYGPYHAPRPRKKRGGLKAPHFTENQILELEIINFENYCHFHKKALKKMIKGGSARNLFSQRELFLLGRRGVIRRIYNRHASGHWVVTPKALEILTTLKT